MKKLLFCLVALGGALFAQNLTGTWQGSLQPPQGKALRIVVKISRADDESLKAVFYSIDQGGQPLSASTASQQGSTFKMTLAAVGGTYEGKLSGDGNTLTGSWSQGGPALPLELVRATPATAWAIPEPPPPPKVMAADAKPTFEVSTIKPSNPETPGKSILVGRGGGNLFTTTNTTLTDLITVAYGLQARQVTGGPSWLEEVKYDITGKPDQPGVPNVAQMKEMIKVFLADRFQLKFHQEKKELPVYALTVVKTGAKMEKTQATGNLPGFGGRGAGGVSVRNSTMEEFAGFLQSRVERPVVDRTGLTDRFDFTLLWTPDAAQLAQMGPNAPATPANPDAPPDLFAAIQQQLGLKLESSKAPVDVIVIDRVEKPSEN